MPTVTALITGTEFDPADNALKTRFLGSVRETLDVVLKFIMAFGICFQLPVLLTLMGKAGLVSAEGLRNVRKFAIVGILILAGIVTPPDVVTQVILFVVVYGLYEISIWLVVYVERKRNAYLREQGVSDDDLFSDDGQPGNKS
jgi:sec-independent protein translocase protein TatC